MLEMLLAVTVFVIFLTATTGSYLSLARAIGDANQERKVYSAAQELIKFLAEEARDFQFDYDCYRADSGDCKDFVLKGESDFVLKNRLGDRRFLVKLADDGGLLVRKRVRDPRQDRRELWTDAEGYNGNWASYSLPEGVKIAVLRFRLTPAENPFTAENGLRTEFQFQPQISVFLTLKSPLQRDPAFVFPVQTTISSRIYDKPGQPQ